MSTPAFLSTVKAKLLALSGLFVLMVLVLTVYALQVLNTVKTGGPIYRRIAQTRNLRADILPPSQYLIETELTAFQMANDALAGAPDAVLTRYEKKLKQLKKSFDAGQESWDAQLPGGTVRERQIRVALLEENSKAGGDYFSVVLGDFLKAVKARDPKQVNRLLHGSMAQLAVRHRNAIDELARLTDESAREDERFALTFVRQREGVAILLILGSILVATVSAFVIMRSITVPVGAATGAVKRLETGDLNARVAEPGKDELGQMCASLNAAITAIRVIVQNTGASSGSLERYASGLSTVAASVNVGIQRQATNLVETSAQLGEVAALSQAMAAEGREGQQAAVQSLAAANEGIEVIRAAIAGMGQIGKSAAEINQIVDAVDEICFNTNLLAVNASVEAAVAGEKGRGFRVVAEEIKSLSVRTDAAGKKIRQLIQDANEAIAQGTERVAASGRAFEGIATSVRRLKAIMDNVAWSSTTQAEALSQLKEAVNEIAEVVEQNSIGTETINNTAQQLSKEAQTMHQLVSSFRV